MGLISLAVSLRAQTDNFDSGTDAGWSKITSANFPATYSFPADSFGGHAYRLQATNAIGGVNTPRVIAYRADRLYTNFFVAADIVAWDSLPYTNDMVFGLIGRGNDLNTGNSINAATLTTRINRFTTPEGIKGQTQIYSFFFGAPGAPATQDFFSTLVSGRKYRFTFSAVSNIYSAAVYDLEDLTFPLIAMTGDDSAGTFPTTGYSGIFTFSYPGSNRVDTTFDNFVASESAPTSVSAPATPHGLTGAPQVVNRTPRSFANFYPAASGLSFNATTLTTTNPINTSAIRLFLNGVNVSSALNISGPPTNALVSYSGLTSNAVYDARIELQDALGRHTTNIFTFDTFTDAYLSSASARNIECEDFDYYDNSSNTDGLFINDPLPSGITTNGASVNTSGGGYYNLDGINASVGGLDFYTTEGGVSADWSDFRVLPIATLQGNRNFAYYWYPSNTTTYIFDRTYDTQRQKYYNADTNNPPDRGLEEYDVVRTRDGMWLNFTRIFPSNSFYNVYLRHASAASQTLSLDQVAGGVVTNNLGTFGATNALWTSHYRYAPLRDGSGKLAVANLSGTNTLRLTVAGTDDGPTRYVMSLQYLAFVPALLVESAAKVSGPYSVEPNASVEPGTRQITLPRSGGTRFYRLRWDHAVRIASIALAGGNVALTYQ
ncbi:MAG: hypothetical protein DME25_08905 [Verrucomicrobia bacterium]|nr:MAG: hypothetical protein DME25_08905 [Verrucomicrobiota bacterium]